MTTSDKETAEFRYGIHQWNRLNESSEDGFTIRVVDPSHDEHADQNTEHTADAGKSHSSGKQYSIHDGKIHTATESEHDRIQDDLLRNMVLLHSEYHIDIP